MNTVLDSIIILFKLLTSTFTPASVFSDYCIYKFSSEKGMNSFYITFLF